MRKGRAVPPKPRKAIESATLEASLTGHISRHVNCPPRIIAGACIAANAFAISDGSLGAISRAGGSTEITELFGRTNASVFEEAWSDLPNKYPAPSSFGMINVRENGLGKAAATLPASNVPSPSFIEEHPNRGSVTADQVPQSVSSDFYQTQRLPNLISVERSTHVSALRPRTADLPYASEAALHGLLDSDLQAGNARPIDKLVAATDRPPVSNTTNPIELIEAADVESSLSSSSQVDAFDAAEIAIVETDLVATPDNLPDETLGNAIHADLFQKSTLDARVNGV